MANRVIRRILSSFEKSCLPREIKPPEWNLSLVLKCLTCHPYEPMKLSSDKHLICKTFFLLLMLRPKWLVSCMIFRTESKYRSGWKSCTLAFAPDFITKSQNPLVLDPRFLEFIISLLMDLWVGIEERCCSALSEQSGSTCHKQYRLACTDPFFSATKRKKWVSQNIIFILGLVRLVINHT